MAQKLNIDMGFKTRLWCFTNFKLDFDYKSYFETVKPQYIIYGLEVCPDTKKEHHQGFVYFPNQRGSVKAVAKELGQCHVEMCKGNVDDNVAYCSKDGNVTEYGDRPEQGKRVDLCKMKDDLMAGLTTVDDILMDNPHAYHQYGRTLNKIEDIALRKRFRTEMTQCDWFYGPTGTGKSHQAFKDFNPETHYVHPLQDSGWWDGYTGQQTVIINEFRGQIQFSELLDLIDKWPKTVPRRNREPVPFLAHKIIITSALHPQACYRHVCKGDSYTQLQRRINIVHLTDTQQNGSEVL